MEKLKSAPLQEVVFEIHWKIPEAEDGSLSDFPLKIVAGSMFENLKSTFTFWEALPFLSFPDSLTPYKYQYRFRVAEDKYPLYQLGPGIMSFNMDSNYSWNVFYNYLNQVVEQFCTKYNEINKSNIQLKMLRLRYINNIKYDIKSLDFLKDDLMLNLQYDMDEDILKLLNKNPGLIDIKLSYECSDPIGDIFLRFLKEVKGETSMIWELVYQSYDLGEIDDYTNVLAWVDKAHALLENWFFKNQSKDQIERYKK